MTTTQTPSDLRDAIRLAGAASAWKQACRVVTTSAVTLAGLQVLDGVQLAAGDRILVNGQGGAVAHVDNRILLAGDGPWQQAEDFSGDLFVVLGSTVRVLEGTVGAGTQWTLSTPTTGKITVGATALKFKRDPEIIVLPTSVPTGTIPAGHVAVGFNGADLVMRVGTTNYTLNKTAI